MPGVQLCESILEVFTLVLHGSALLCQVKNWFEEMKDLIHMDKEQLISSLKFIDNARSKSLKKQDTLYIDS